jgi:hypothetical protein
VVVQAAAVDNLIMRQDQVTHLQLHHLRVITADHVLETSAAVVAVVLDQSVQARQQ